MSEGGLYYTEEETNNFKRAFSFVATAVEGFANKHQLLIEKYYYGGPKWALVFNRKIGGVAQIYIDCLDTIKLDFVIGVIWHMDSYETEIRHSKFSEIGRYKYDNDLKFLTSILEKSLQTIKNWKFEDLDQHYGGMREWKQYWKTEEEFKRATINKYPILDI